MPTGPPAPTGTGRGLLRDVMALVLAALALGAVFSAVGAALRHSSPGAELRLIRRVDEGPSAVLTSAAKVFSLLGSQGVLVSVAVVICIVLVLRAARRTAAFLATSVVGGIALSAVVKVIVARPRPALRHLVHVASWSFPSGHATQNAAILPALAIAAAALGVRRSVALTVAVIGAIAVGISRVLLGVHYPSDVIAGWLLGGLWCATSYAVIIARWRGRGRPSEPAAARRT